MPTEPLTILLVEDDPDVLEATALMLEAEGFAVLAARELEGARALAEQHPGCLTLLDLSLEGDLEDFIRALRAELSGGPVFLYSAGDRLLERAEALGADGAVPKPFDVEKLVHLLRQVGQGLAGGHPLLTLSR